MDEDIKIIYRRLNQLMGQKIATDRIRHARIKRVVGIIGNDEIVDAHDYFDVKYRGRIRHGGRLVMP